jgi:hypothetical protein
MSERSNHSEDKVLSRMIALEETQLTGGLGSDKIAAVKARLAAEKAAILTKFDSTPVLALRKTGRAKVWGSLAAAALLVMGIGVLWLVRAPASTDAILAYTKGAVRLQGTPVAPGLKLPGTGTLSTEEKSLAVVRVAEPVSILALAKTQMQLKPAHERDGLPAASVALESGQLFVQVDRGAAHFSMTTPTTVLGVRGTGFSVQVGAEGTTVRVLEGTVEATSGAGKSTLIEAGQRLSINPTTGPGVIGALSAAEKNELRRFAGLVTLSREKTDAAQVNQADALAAAILESDAQPAPAQAARTTLAEIRQKYGKISRVNLKSGASYTGFFRLNGAQMEIITPGGTVRVPTAQLKDVQDVD